MNISNIIITWIVIVIVILSLLLNNQKQLKYYNIGPNDNLFILEIPLLNILQ